MKFIDQKGYKKNLYTLSITAEMTGELVSLIKEQLAAKYVILAGTWLTKQLTTYVV